LITRALPTWIIAITTIVVLQTTSAYLGRLVPIAAPEFMREFGWDGSWVGYLSAANVIGALFILTAGIGTIKRMGGVLALQAGLIIGAASLVLYLVPSLAVALITDDEALKTRFLTRSHAHRLNLGAIPTPHIGWDQPHEGNLFEHLYSRRAIQFQKAS